MVGRIPGQWLWWGLTALFSAAGCNGPLEHESPAPVTPRPQVDTGPPEDVVAIMTCASGPPKVLSDGRQTRGLKEALVVRKDGRVELRDREPTGMVIGAGSVAAERIAKLTTTLARPEWADLVHKRGAPFPDGPWCEILASHRLVERYELPEDEAIFKEVRAELRAMWKEVDPWTAPTASAPSAATGPAASGAPSARSSP